jgi:predicted Zn-dependent protease
MSEPDQTMHARTGAEPTTADASDAAARVLEHVRERNPRADAEVVVQQGETALTRFANGFIHQNVASEVCAVDLRVAIDGRNAAASLEGPLADEALARLVDEVLEAARVRPPDPDWPGLASVVAAPAVDHWDDATAAAAAGDRATAVAAFVDAAGGLETAGACETTGLVVAFANSAGQRLAGRWTSAALDGIARTSTSDGSARRASARLSEIDGGALGAEAAERARGSAEPGDLEPGRYAVVLEPQCVANMLEFLFVHGFNGRAVTDGTSFARLGEPQLDAAISIDDDATHPATIGIGFDVEGTPKRRVAVVERGVTRAVLHNRRTAARTGGHAVSTGHAGRDEFAPGAQPSNVILAPGERPHADLVRGIRRGLLVTDFWYTRILDPRTQVVTGLTRNGVWLVEQGEIVRAVRNVRFTQSFLDALGPGNVLGVGAHPALITGHSVGSYLVPAVHLASWNVTGNARG